MIVIPADKGYDVVLVAFKRGEYVLEGLTEYLKKEKADAGLIISGIGSLDICRIHMIEHSNVPPNDLFIDLKGPVEVSSLVGSIAGGEPHIHVTVQDVKNDKVYCGHLEAGSRCCYRIEVGLMLFRDITTQRIVDEATGLIDIVPAGEL